MLVRCIGHKKIPIGHKKIPIGHKKIPIGHKKIPIGHKKIPKVIRKFHISHKNILTAMSFNGKMDLTLKGGYYYG